MSALRSANPATAGMRIGGHAATRAPASPAPKPRTRYVTPEETVAIQLLP
jgi:hypothetical protein